jgi:hypothetical protein
MGKPRKKDSPSSKKRYHTDFESLILAASYQAFKVFAGNFLPALDGNLKTII